MLSAVMHKIQTVLYRQELQHSLEWMDTLTEMDEIDALKETTSHLTKIQFDSNEALNIGIDLILEIDSKTYRSAKKITYKYLTMLKKIECLRLEFSMRYIHTTDSYMLPTRNF